MTLLQAIDSFVTSKRSPGMTCKGPERMLRAFARATGDIPVRAISSEQARAFCLGTGPPTLTHVQKHGRLRQFFRYLVARGHLDASPLPEPGPRATSSLQPRIYTSEEVRSLLAATETLRDSRRPLRAETYRTLLLVLHATGLRPGETLRLRLCDVDLADCCLTIWNSKFFKSRLVPFSPPLRDVLQAYRSARLDLPRPCGDRSAFFPTPQGGTLPYNTLAGTFARLRERSGLRNPDPSGRHPRLHDLRHTFALSRLLAWYRAGADVQERLPWLSTYLGHADPSGTQRYLAMTPELLAEASRRFERYAAPGKPPKGDTP